MSSSSRTPAVTSPKLTSMSPLSISAPLKEVSASEMSTLAVEVPEPELEPPEEEELPSS